MTTLSHMLLREDVRAELVADLAVILDDEIGRWTGLRGLAVRSSWATMKAMKPGFARRVCDRLLDGCVAELEPLYTAWERAPERASTTFGGYLRDRPERVAEVLVSVANDKASNTSNRLARALYAKVGPNARDGFVAVVPRLASLFDHHLARAA